MGVSVVLVLVLGVVLGVVPGVVLWVAVATTTGKTRKNRKEILATDSSATMRANTLLSKKRFLKPPPEKDK